MLEISLDSDLNWSVKFRIEGVQITHLVSGDYQVVRQEIEKKMLLAMGLAKGKVFTTKTGREI